MQETVFECGRYRLHVGGSHRPLVMGILNVTPDSFSDGGRFVALESAITQAERMIAEGVDILDIGGESSRPGAEPLPLEEELRRVIPVVYALRDCGKPLSIDTYKPEVMHQALEAGADMINDIYGLRQPGAIEVVRDADCGICIMHMQHDPKTMQIDPAYEDVATSVLGFFQEALERCDVAGIRRQRLCLDPGFGFGKTREHNMALLKHIAFLAEATGQPMLAGLSRKAMLGAITGKPVEGRLAASLAAALAAAAQGAALLRVHDVGETVDALKVWHAFHVNTD